MTNINIDSGLYEKLKLDYKKYPKLIYPSFKYYIEHKLLNSLKRIKESEIRKT